MNNLFQTALDLAGYEIEESVSLEVQFQNMFIDCVNDGIYSDITCEEEALDFIEEVGLEKVAKWFIRLVSRLGYRFSPIYI